MAAILSDLTQTVAFKRNASFRSTIEGLMAERMVAKKGQSVNGA